MANGTICDEDHMDALNPSFWFTSSKVAYATACTLMLDTMKELEKTLTPQTSTTTWKGW